VLLLLLASGCTRSGEEYVSWQADQPLVLDGQKEAVWLKAESKRVDKITLGEFYRKDSLDLAARYRSLWTQAGIYFLVEVQDDVVFTSNELAEYNCDAVEIFLDLHNDKEEDFKVGDDFQYVFRYDYRKIFCKCSSQENVKAVLVRTGTGYNAEIFIPWKTLGVEPGQLDRVGFNVNIYDNDTRPTDDLIKSRETALSLTKEGKHSWQWTSVFSTMAFNK
jgi:predicted Fe-S protein YdhL (DUF1289 family)